MSRSEAMSWQKAVAALTAERGRAEAAAGVIKRLGAPADVAAAELTYGAGRAEAEAVVSALVVALEKGEGADDFAELEAGLTAATADRRRAIRLQPARQRFRLDLVLAKCESLRP